MNDSVVRIESISINNFKNVVKGELSFENTRKKYHSSILGLYGQNGSGKTALIDAFSLLRYILCGREIPYQFAEYINVDASFSEFEFVFKVKKQDDVNEDTAGYRVRYIFRIRSERDDSYQNIGSGASDAEKFRITVFHEQLSYSFESGDEKRRFAVLIDTRGGDPFTPKSKRTLLTGGDKSAEMHLMVAKKLTAATARSFVFSGELLSTVRKYCADQTVIALLERLAYFGNYEFFVIGPDNMGRMNLNALPLAFRENGSEHHSAICHLMLPLDGATTIPGEELELVKKAIDDMNIVLVKIIPGLTIGLRELGMQLLPSGKNGCRVQLMSQKNSKDIPLAYESEGIKKIISILQLLIVIYNKPSVTVAIDELDAGVFEYLLGEILRIISEKGKGQLIFCSHNLRPLETLDRGFIAFTTTNPENRYVRLPGIKGSSNLRDFYYRDIVLGEQSETVYNTTNNYEIALAFREAGDLSGS